MEKLREYLLKAKQEAEVLKTDDTVKGYALSSVRDYIDTALVIIDKYLVE